MSDLDTNNTADANVIVQGLNTVLNAATGAARDTAAMALRGQISPTSQAKYKPNKVKRVFAGFDSLTEGANGTNPASYLTPMSAALRSRFGDGGIGCLTAENGPMTPAGFGKTSGLSYISSLAKTDTKARQTLSFQGLYTTGATGTDTMSYNPQTGDGHGSGNLIWTSARIYFILRSASSSMTLRTSNNVATDLVSDAIFEVGVPQVATYFARTGDSQVFQANAITGNVTILAVEFFNETLSGVAVSRAARGGVMATELATMDDTINRAWWRLLAPDIFLYKIGINDRLSYSALQFANAAELQLRRIIESSPKTKVVIIRANDPEDWATTNFKDYDKVLISIALAHGCAYADERDAVGVYSAALASAFMDGADGVHPTQAGKTAIGAYHASILTP